MNVTPLRTNTPFEALLMLMCLFVLKKYVINGRTGTQYMIVHTLDHSRLLLNVFTCEWFDGRSDTKLRIAYTDLMLVYFGVFAMNCRRVTRLLNGVSVVVVTYRCGLFFRCFHDRSLLTL